MLKAIIDKNRKRQSIRNIRQELEEILKFLELYKDDKGVSNEIYIPIWETIIGNGDILSYYGESYYNNLIEIYSHILSLKEIEQSLNYINNLNDRKEYMGNIIKKRREVYSKLSSLDINTLR